MPQEGDLQSDYIVPDVIRSQFPGDADFAYEQYSYDLKDGFKVGQKLRVTYTKEDGREGFRLFFLGDQTTYAAADGDVPLTERAVLRLEQYDDLGEKHGYSIYQSDNQIQIEMHEHGTKDGLAITYNKVSPHDIDLKNRIEPLLAGEISTSELRLYQLERWSAGRLYEEVTSASYFTVLFYAEGAEKKSDRSTLSMQYSSRQIYLDAAATRAVVQGDYSGLAITDIEYYRGDAKAKIYFNKEQDFTKYEYTQEDSETKKRLKYELSYVQDERDGKRADKLWVDELDGSIGLNSRIVFAVCVDSGASFSEQLRQNGVFMTPESLYEFARTVVAGKNTTASEASGLLAFESYSQFIQREGQNHRLYRRLMQEDNGTWSYMELPETGPGRRIIFKLDASLADSTAVVSFNADRHLDEAIEIERYYPGSQSTRRIERRELTEGGEKIVKNITAKNRDGEKDSVQYSLDSGFHGREPHAELLEDGIPKVEVRMRVTESGKYMRVETKTGLQYMARITVSEEWFGMDSKMEIIDLTKEPENNDSTIGTINWHELAPVGEGSGRGGGFSLPIDQWKAMFDEELPNRDLKIPEQCEEYVVNLWQNSLGHIYRILQQGEIWYAFWEPEHSNDKFLVELNNILEKVGAHKRM